MSHLGDWVVWISFNCAKLNHRRVHTASADAVPMMIAACGYHIPLRPMVHLNIA